MKTNIINKDFLYRRNNAGDACFWYASKNEHDSIIVEYGIVGKKKYSHIIYTERDLDKEIKSMFAAKRKKGYIDLSEIRDDNLPVEDGEAAQQWINTYLPTVRTNNGVLLPMLAKTYDDNIWKNGSEYFAQPKINGLRCFIKFEPAENSLFNKYKIRFYSREGIEWNSLSNLEDYLLNEFNDKLIEELIDNNIILDGELYIPGKTVNEINSAVKNVNNPDNVNLQYWCFDIAVDEMNAEYRSYFIRENFYKYIKYDLKLANKENTDRFVNIDHVMCYSHGKAVEFRDKYISYGFEGLILRDYDKEYQYGKRNNSMIKYKRSTDGKFTIVDIVPEGIKRPDIPKIICRNDINNELFETRLSGNLNFQKGVLQNKNNFIGKQLYVEFGERSGVNLVPFHIKTTYIIM